MLGIEARNARTVRGLRKFIERSVAFAQRNNLLLGRRRGKNFAKSPHAAAIKRCV